MSAPDELRGILCVKGLMAQEEHSDYVESSHSLFNDEIRLSLTTFCSV